MRSTFAGFTTASLAMRASQKALDVTGQNIANINTAGYTRQRLDLISLHTGNGMEKYKSQYAVSVGNGVLATGVSQIRDPFLDIRFRNEIANVGGAEQKLDILKDLENIFDEVSKTGIQNQFSDLSTMLQKLSDNVGNKEFDSMVRASADVLVKMINQYANQLEVVKEEHTYNLENIDIPNVNDILRNIKELNENIKTTQVYGGSPLELIDQRNMLIDELASFMDIDVKVKTELVAGDPNGRKIETLEIYLKGTDDALVKDNEYVKLGMETSPEGKVTLKKTDLTEGKIPEDAAMNALDEGKLKNGILKSTLDMLNKKGDFDTPASDTRGIGYYEESLNLFARQIAQVFNDLNNIDKDNNPDGNAYDLFRANGTDTDPSKITAKNLRISQDWLSGKVGINPAKDGSTTGKNDNILAMIDAIKSKKDYKAENGTTIFNGTFQEYFTNTGSVLGLDVKATDSLLDNYTTVANDIANMRDNISSVSLDEEGVNILHYQKSYNAAARLMTALDEAVATIINNMGVVGR